MRLNGSALNVEELNGGTSFFTLDLTAAVFTFVVNTCQLKRAVQMQIGSLDFSRQIMSLAVLNNLATAAFDFVQPGISAAQGATLSTATFAAWVANPVQLALASQLAAGALNFTGQPIGQVASTTLSTAVMDFAEQDVAPTRSVALNPAAFDFVGQTSTPAATVTLSTAVVTFVPLDVTPSNAPLGEVVNLTNASFNFATNDVTPGNSITLDSALFTFTPTDVQNSTSMTLTASNLKMTPQSVEVLQATVQVLLTTAIFDFVPRSLQLTGLSSAGDRKRMLFGVGR